MQEKTKQDETRDETRRDKTRQGTEDKTMAGESPKKDVKISILEAKTYVAFLTLTSSSKTRFYN